VEVTLEAVDLLEWIVQTRVLVVLVAEVDLEEKPITTVVAVDLEVE
jgi:hypothetical protein